jgi:predicted ribosome quality control (RQC) complex YloA/Tae2 family protein
MDEESGIGHNIELKPGLTPSENANYYFDKYKKNKGSGEFLSNKIKSEEMLTEKLKNEIMNIENSDDIKDLKKDLNTREKDSYKNKFRIFSLNENYEVWVGKDSVSNDLLTFKYSSPFDYWFHVRGFSGSHTVLKRFVKDIIPDRKIVETAASIAAYYSKARNAGTIPVAYCERKYVKKRKGFKSGTVTMEKEKLIYVKPHLPVN